MSQPLELTQKRMRDILDRKQVTHTIDSDGDIVIPLNADQNCPYGVVCFISLTPEGILTLRGHPDHKIPESRFAEAILFCNRWNLEKRWPTAYFMKEKGTVFADIHFDFGTKVHDEMLDATMLKVGLIWALYVELAKSGL